LATVAVTLTEAPWSVCVAEADNWTEIGGAELEQEHEKAMARNPVSAAARLSFPILEALSTNNRYSE
jgi:hypothetical protein